MAKRKYELNLTLIDGVTPGDPGKILLWLYEDGDESIYSYARLRSDGDLYDVAQAISYASRQMMKIAEQRGMERERRGW